MSISTVEQRKIALHPMAIYSFIKAQAGSLEKAIAEAVMNSIDAFATTISISINSTGFTIEDNGQGFQSVDEIAAWFESIGFPHDEENHRQYGKFGMGRAQMWAYASTVWTSNQFIMDVDVQKNGLDYSLDESVSSRFKGTSIKGKFYKHIDVSTLDHVIKGLKDLLQFAPTMITVNGVSVNKNPELMDWDIETPDVWIKLDRSMNKMSIYNAGILVNHFWRGKYNTDFSGLILTKPGKTLSLNIARTDVLTDECKVWKRIKEALPSIGNKPEKKAARSKVSPEVAKSLIQKVTSGSASLFDVMDSEEGYGLLENVLGRSLDSSYFQSSWNPFRDKPISVSPKNDSFGKQAYKLKLAMVISKESLENCGLTLDQLKALVNNELSLKIADKNNDHVWVQERLKALVAREYNANLTEMFPSLVSDIKVISKSEMTESEKDCVRCLTKPLNDFRLKLLPAIKLVPGNTVDSDNNLPNLISALASTYVCEMASDDVAAYVDGVGICFNRRKLKAYMDKGATSIASMLNDLLVSVILKNHIPEFVQLSSKTTLVGDTSVVIAGAYYSLCSSKSIDLTKTFKRVLSVSAILADEVEDTKDSTTIS